ncbi:hypothetical protein Zmor_003886 [Zophobas morio]|jgi:hypothetical protein|uniref:Uncharacterized protein n=1 Tax=Zophobas morio TaxID=2755281 RepID=A0AA38HIC8_9CUCU|nr:hypothetical protein Zmor_003886 [Zophobas morio]
MALLRRFLIRRLRELRYLVGLAELEVAQSIEAEVPASLEVYASGGCRVFLLVVKALNGELRGASTFLVSEASLVSDLGFLRARLVRLPFLYFFFCFAHYYLRNSQERLRSGLKVLPKGDDFICRLEERVAQDESEVVGPMPCAYGPPLLAHGRFFVISLEESDC